MNTTQPGIRISPTVQQGGTQTIQQSIYLTHNNPCGINLLAFQEIGSVKISFLQLKNYLDAILNEPEVQEQFKVVREKGTEFLRNPTEQTQLAYLYAIMIYGEIAERFVPEQVSGYNWRLSIYDINGVMLWFARPLRIVVTLPNGLYDWGTVNARMTFNAKSPNQSVVFDNPFILPTQTTIRIYSLCNNITLTGMFDRRNSRARLLSRSAYSENQCALPESTMALTSLLSDPANTRVYGYTRYGFSARQVTFNSALVGYNCCYLQEIKTLEKTPELIENIYVRLSLDQINLVPIGGGTGV